MLKRALFFSTPFCLNLRDNQLIIHTKEAPDMQKSIPIEDIGIVVLEHQQTSVTLPLLNALSDNNVAVILCGGNRFFNDAVFGLCPTLRLEREYGGTHQPGKTLNAAIRIHGHFERYRQTIR